MTKNVKTCIQIKGSYKVIENFENLKFMCFGGNWDSIFTNTDRFQLKEETNMNPICY